MGMILSSFHKVLNSRELHLLFNLKPLQMCDSPVYMAPFAPSTWRVLSPYPVLTPSKAQLKLHHPFKIFPIWSRLRVFSLFYNRAESLHRSLLYFIFDFTLSDLLIQATCLPCLG